MTGTAGTQRTRTGWTGRERRVGRLTTFRSRWYWWGTAGWLVWFSWPVIPGWLLARTFDEFQGHGASGRLGLLLVGLFCAEVAAAVLLRAADTIYAQGTEASMALTRLNVVHAQLASGGADAGPRTVATGDAVSRLRDDPFDVLLLGDNWVDLFGSIAYGVVATTLLARIDPLAALVGVVPLFLIGFANSRVGNVIRGLRQRARQATSEVSGFLNAVFEASLTVRLSGAQPDVLRRLDQLNRRRADAMVRDQVWSDAQFSVNFSLTDVSVGLALVVASRNRLEPGEISLFASYLFHLVWLPHRLGGVIVGRRRFDVSAGRLDAMLSPHSGADRLTEHRPLPILGGGPVPGPAAAPRQPLERLECPGPDDRRPWRVRRRPRVDRRDLDRGQRCGGEREVFAAARPRGPVGARRRRGALERALVTDRAAFLVPPHCAYVAQVPRLFAENLADNLRLGHDLSDDQLFEAVRLAAFDRDVAELPRGLVTLIGTRGVRLSGGQAQRAAAARALAHRPELVVIDDLSSALDIDTELALWDRLAAAGLTVLAASNRPAALARADQVIHLQHAGERSGPPSPASRNVATWEARRISVHST